MSMHGMEATEAPSYRWQNERLLLEFIKKQLDITDEDLQSETAVKSKIRDAKIEKVIK